MQVLGGALALLVGIVGGSRAATINGYVDGFGSEGAAGWACSAHPADDVAVAAYAGPYLLGVYPRNVARPDVASFCPGAQLSGFAFRFDPVTQSLFAGQATLSLQAIANGRPSRLLPGSNPRTIDPLPLPSGRLVGIGNAGQVAAIVTGRGGAPAVSLFANGPSDEGLGVQRGSGSLLSPGLYGVRLPAPGISAWRPIDSLLTIWGSVTDMAGVTAPMQAPMTLTLHDGVLRPAQSLGVSATATQAGAVSGITNKLATTWLPAGSGFAGLSGMITFSGNDSSFSEALVELGTTTDSQASCLARNGQMPVGIPVISRLWAGILKSNDTLPVSIPVEMALNHPVPEPLGGACLMTWVSAGYPFLSAGVARYTKTSAMLQVSAAPVATRTARALPFGMGGEFRTVPGLAQPGGVYVGLIAEQALAVDGIAVTLSAAPVVGAPTGTNWLSPSGFWAAGASFFYLPAPVCAAAHLHAQLPVGPAAVLRNFTPATFTIPPGAIELLSAPMFSHGTTAVQRSAFISFPTRGFHGSLATGDCIVAFMVGDTGVDGSLDVENQSTVYLRIQ